MTNEKRSWLLLISLALIWGSSFILMDRSMHPVNPENRVMGPFQVGSLRVVIAGLALMPFAWRHLKLLGSKDVGWLILVGVCGNFLPAFLFTLAETRIAPSLAGILNMGTSFFVVLIGVVIYHAKPTWKQLLGMAIGAIGLYGVLNAKLAFEWEDVQFALFVLLATFCYAISLTTIKFKLSAVKPHVITSLSFFVIFFPGLIVALSVDAFQPILHHPDGLKSLSYLSVLSIVGTAFAVFIFTKLVSIANHIFASAVTYLIPVVAVIIGFFTEAKFEMAAVIWMVVILGGVYLMNKKGKTAVNKDQE